MCLKEGCQFNSVSEQVFQWAARCYHYDESAVEIMQMSLQEKKRKNSVFTLFGSIGKNIELVSNIWYKN